MCVRTFHAFFVVLLVYNYIASYMAWFNSDGVLYYLETYIMLSNL